MRCDEIVKVRESRRVLDLLKCRIWPAVAQIELDRIVEQHRVLRNDAKLQSWRNN